MKYNIEVYEKNGDSYFWVVDNIEEIGNTIKFYYYTEEMLEEIQKIEVYPLTDDK